ncbi:LEA type 2 family protein [Thalassotalea aquiviva]|uniref:LEA type 2 family protein n=1 Tax=Thalassotalea aquiviva TaxID=3242415 RepID=UPI00352A74A1
MRNFCLFGCLLWCLSGCANIIDLEEPKVNLVGIKSVKSNSASPRFMLNLMVANPNNRDLEINGVTFDFKVGSRTLLSGVANNIPTLTAYAETPVNVEASMNFMDMLMLLAQFADAPQDDLSYTLRTRIDPKGFMTFDIEHKGALNDDLKRVLKSKR